MNKDLERKIRAIFSEKFGNKPDVMVFSPGRINLIGEHTDYNQGFVFPAAIDKGIVIALQKTANEHCSVYALDKEEKVTFSLNELHPASQGSWVNYVLGVVAGIQQTEKKLSAFNVVFGGNIPEGAGLSSSAALSNGVVFSLNELFQLKLSKHEMILLAQKAEHDFAGVKCGIMDQYACMFGEENSALLLDCRTIQAIPHEIDFNDHQLLLVNTNVNHNLADSAYNERRSVCESVATMTNATSLRDVTINQLEEIKSSISVEDYGKALYVIEENDRVLKASKAIDQGNMEVLGQLLYASHEGLQKQYKVSCDELDFLVEKTKENDNVLGSRMMGGGFGGCTINLISKKGVDDFKTQISRAYEAEFGRACTIHTVKLSKGTEVI